MAERLLSVRQRELAQIDRLLERDDAPQATLLQVTGESGIGKTQLLKYTLARAGELGRLTVMGRAAEFEADEPFGLFLGPLEGILAELPDEALGRLLIEDCRELASLLPAFAVRIPEPAGGASFPPSGVGVDRYRLHRAICGLLDLFAAGRRILLAVDDLHWADAASVELLLYLVRRPPISQLDVAVTLRPAQLEPATAAALQQLQRDSHAELIELMPLAADEANAFYPAEMPSILAQRIYKESGGNPFYLEELIRVAGVEFGGGAALVDSDAERLPTRVSAFIDGELARLSPRSLELGQAASMVGDPFEPELAGEIIAMEEPETMSALDELVDRELVCAAPVPGRFSFRHPIVRRAVYESAKGGWRRSAHARAAVVLAERGASASARARHIERSARVGDSEAIDVLKQAGYESAARAPAAAARWFRAALHLLPEGSPARDRRELLLALAVSLGSAGSLTESRQAFGEVIALLPAESPLASVVVVGASRVDHMLGQHDDAQGRLLSRLSELDDASAEAASLKLSIATGCFFSADWTGMRYWAQETAKLSDCPAILRAGSGGVLALAQYGLGEIEAAGAAATESASLADRLSDADWSGQLGAICLLGWAEYCLGRLHGAEQHVKRALEVAGATGQQHLSAAMLSTRATCNLALGRLTMASEQAENAIDSSLLAANHLFLTWALSVRCTVEIERGSPASAVRYGIRALEAGIKSRSPWSTVASLALAEARLEAGEPEQFRRQLLVGQTTPRLPPFLFYAVHGYELLSRAELELGLTDAAARWASQATELAQQLGLPGPSAEAERAEAMLMLARGACEEAAVAAQTSAKHAELAGQPLQVARSRLVEGTALARAGHTADAVAQLRRAQETFSTHGATRYRDRTEQELRRLGVRGLTSRRQDRTETAIGALSPRELTIARLVHQGMSNRQISDELSISVKTVENHLTNIFRRLEISSRAARDAG